MNTIDGEFSLMDLVDYQAGAIVSNTILKQESGSVTLFAFDTSESLSEHTAPFDALVQVLEGELEIHIAGQPYLLSGNASIILPANKPHALKAIQQAKMLLTMIKS